MSKARHRLLADRGFTLAELIIALAVLSVVVTGVAGLVLLGSKQLHYGDADGDMWAAVVQQVEDLRAQGHDNVVNGSSTINGVALSWVVTGSTPKKLVLVAMPRPGASSARPDTFVTMIGRAGP